MVLYKLLDKYLIKEMIDEINKYIDPISNLMLMYSFNENITYVIGRKLIVEHLKGYYFDYTTNKKIIDYLKTKDLWDYRIF